MKRLLLDTHIWLSIQAEPARIPAHVQQVLADPSSVLFLSLVSAWEIAVKYSFGRLPIPAPPDVYVPDRLAGESVTLLPVALEDVLGVAGLPHLHRDPFDRSLVTQATRGGFALVTADRTLAAYGVDVIEV